VFFVHFVAVFAFAVIGSCPHREVSEETFPSVPGGMNMGEDSKWKLLCAVGVLGFLGLVGAIRYLATFRSVPTLPSSRVEGIRPPEPARRGSRQEDPALHTNLPSVVFSIPSFVSEVGDGTNSPRASIEVCLIDAATRLPVNTGRIGVKEDHSRQTLGDYDLGGQSCAVIQIDPGIYALQVGADGYQSVEQTLTIGSNLDHIRKVFSLFRNYLVRGIVRNSNGLPQPDACISLFQETYHVTVRSGAGGRFETELFTPEIQKIYAFKPPNPIATLGPVVIGESRDPNLVITLPEDSRTFKVSGTVFDDLDRPVEGALVTLLATAMHHVPDKVHDAALQGLQQMSARSDAKGRYSLEALPQSEAFLTIAGAKGCEPATESVVLERNVVKDVRLLCHPTFKVSVQDQGGNGFADSVIVAETAEGESAIVPTAEKGRYFAREYPFRIIAWNRWPDQDAYGVARSEWIQSYRESIFLVLGNARVDGIVIAGSGEPVRNFIIRLRLPDAPFANVTFPYASEIGSFNLKHLPPGLLTLEVIGEITGTDGERVRVSFTQELTLVEGQTAFLSAILKRPGNGTSATNRILSLGMAILFRGFRDWISFEYFDLTERATWDMGNGIEI
jgi:hypothetical protein